MRQASTTSLNEWRERQRHQIGTVRRLILVNLWQPIWSFSGKISTEDCMSELFPDDSLISLLTYIQTVLSACATSPGRWIWEQLYLCIHRKNSTVLESDPLQWKSSSLAIFTEQTPRCLIASTSVCPHLWLPILELKDKQLFPAFQAVTLKATHGQNHSSGRKSLNKLSACLNPSFESVYVKHVQQIIQ